MRRIKRALLAAALASLTLSPSNAAVLTILDGTSTSRNFFYFQDGSSNYFPAVGIYGASGDHQADVNADGGLDAHVTNFPSTFGLTGSLPAFAATPTFNLGTLNGAATAANQEVTAAGTSAASAQGVQGVSGGVPLAGNITQQAGQALAAPTAWGTAPPSGNVISANVNCLTGCSGGSSGTADQTFSPSGGPITVADTGLTRTVAANNAVILTGTVTPLSYLTFTGFSGAQTGWLQCTGSYSSSDIFEVITSPDGTTWTHQASFSGQFSGYVNLTAAEFLMVHALSWTSGSPTCALRVTSNIAQSPPGTVSRPVAALSNTAEPVLAYGGRLTSVACGAESGSSVADVQIFDAPAASVTPGSTAPAAFYQVVGGGGTQGMTLPAGGIAFTSAISAAATTTATGGAAPGSPLDCTFTVAP